MKTIRKEYSTLLVDDDAEFYKIIGPMFNELGLQLVDTVEKASNALERHDFDLILLDLNFNPSNPEDTSGLQLLSHDKTPIIVLTNNGDVSIHNNAQLKGAKRCLYKGAYDPKIWKNIFLDVIREFDQEKNRSEYQALIMKGGGVKGLAYVGALKKLNTFYTFNWFIGTSAGAIAACLLGAGYSVEELEQIIAEKDFKDFLDASFAGACWNFIRYAGLYAGDAFEAWIDQLLAKKLNKSTRVRFKDLPCRVTIYASRRNSSALIFDSLADENCPVAYAVRCSMSIPFIFIPQSKEGMRVFDGGMQNNYPVEQILHAQPNTPFVGLYLGDEHYQGKPKRLNIFKEIFLLYTEGSDIEALEKHEENTVVIDPSPIKTTNFSLSPQQRAFLVAAGELGAMKFLRKKEKITNVDEEILELTIKRNNLRNSISNR